MEGLNQQIEAILFAAARVVSKEELKTFCSASDDEIEAAVTELEKKLNETNSSLMITKEDLGWKIAVREKYTAPLRNIVPNTELSRSILETLAVIAWKQPVMQAEVIDIRTTKAYEHIGELEKLGFITKQKHGRSFILKTSQKFADYFDLPKKEAIDAIFKNIAADKGPQKKIDDVQNMEVYSKEDSETEEPLGKFETYGDSKQRPKIEKEQNNEEEKEEFYEKDEELKELTQKESTHNKPKSKEIKKDIYVELNVKEKSSEEAKSDEDTSEEKEENLESKEESDFKKNPEKKKVTKDGERKLEYELEELIDETKQEKKKEKDEEDVEEYSEEDE